MLSVATRRGEAVLPGQLLRIQQGVSSRQADRLERLGEDATQAEPRSDALARPGAGAGRPVQAQGRSLSAQVQASVQRAKLLVGEYELRAPRAALVDEVFAEPGEQGVAGSTLVPPIPPRLLGSLPQALENAAKSH